MQNVPLDENRRRLKARYIFPVASNPIPDGTVTIDGQRIASVGRSPVGGEVEDLGNAAILPGLVNAHTHLEFSTLQRPLGEPGTAMADWIRQLIGWRRNQTEDRSRAIELGLQESVENGTTMLGEIAQPDWPAEAFEQSPLRATVFQELIAPTADRVPEAMRRAIAHLERSGESRWLAGLSPHAPYTVRRELLDEAVRLSSARRVPLAFHLAESREELELLRHGTGPLAGFLRELETWDSGVTAAGSRPLDYLRRLAAAHRALVIHGNYLDDDEIAFLAGNRGHMAVVYCPRTHEHFHHGDYPLSQMLSTGVAVALGTDSRASSPDLSLLAEMRTVRHKHPAVDPRAVLELGTLAGAQALGMEREVGSLEAGKFADLAIVELPDRDAADPHTLVLDSVLPVIAVWHRGRRVFGLSG